MPEVGAWLHLLGYSAALHVKASVMNVRLTSPAWVWTLAECRPKTPKQLLVTLISLSLVTRQTVSNLEVAGVRRVHRRDRSHLRTRVTRTVRLFTEGAFCPLLRLGQGTLLADAWTVREQLRCVRKWTRSGALSSAIIKETSLVTIMSPTVLLLVVFVLFV